MTTDRVLYLLSCALNAFTVFVLFVIVIPSMDRNHADDMEQSRFILANHELLVENARILEENQRIHKENNLLVHEMQERLGRMKGTLPGPR